MKAAPPRLSLVHDASAQANSVDDEIWSLPDPDYLPPEFSEIELAVRFTRENHKSWRYCATLGRWHVWSGAVWDADETLRAYDLARKVCKDASAQLEADMLKETGDPAKARRGAASIAQASTVAAVERLARADRNHAITVEQLDRDPWILNTKSGIVDLRNNKISEHRPEKYLTKITGAGVGERCDTWRQFLLEVTDGDSEYVEYLQRWAGYSLTGDTSEHAFAFAYGPGGNGKSVFTNTIAKVLGKYSMNCPMETFVATNGDRHPTDLAMLRGARLAVATETEEGRRWAESKIKALTGGDSISARFMRQDFFTFTPQFKLIAVGNHKPAIRNVDHAMRRRLHLLPFTFTPSKPDKDLPARLEAELDGILGWALEGCRMWQSVGLSPPAVVKKATAEYFDTEDALGRWLSDATDTDARFQAVIGTKFLYERWSRWAESAGEYVGSMKRFSENLKNRGFEQGQDAYTRRTGFRGLRLREEPS